MSGVRMMKKLAREAKRRSEGRVGDSLLESTGPVQQVALHAGARSRTSLPSLYTVMLVSLLMLTVSGESSASDHDQGLTAPVDFSGTWMPARGPGATVTFPRADWPFTEHGAALYGGFTAEFDPDKDDDAFFCVIPGMPTAMAAAAPFPMEIIQREHDITLFFEAWSQYRKIYIDGHPRPEPVLPSRMGYSVGQWEGETLVIRTDMLSERTQGRSLMSEEATIVERWRIEEGPQGQRRLVDEMVFRDPVTYTEDIHVRGVWDETTDTPIMEYVCTEELYQQHLERVRQGRNS